MTQNPQLQNSQPPPVRTALYPGSFDPLTYGHLDLIARGAKLFDRLVVGIASNPRKQSLFSERERTDFLAKHTAHLGNVDVVSFSGLVVEYCAAAGIGNMLRGLRSTGDFEYEYRMALTNRALQPSVEVVFVMPSLEFVYLSSSLVKEVVQNGGDASRWLPADVHDAVAAKLRG